MNNILTISGVVKEVAERNFTKKDGSEGTNYDILVEYEDGRFKSNIIVSTINPDLIKSLQEGSTQTFNITVQSNYHSGSGRWFTNAKLIKIN